MYPVLRDDEDENLPDDLLRDVGVPAPPAAEATEPASAAELASATDNAMPELTADERCYIAEPPAPTDDEPDADVVEPTPQAVLTEPARAVGETMPLDDQDDQPPRNRAMRPSIAALQQQADELRKQLWHPELVDELVTVAEGALKAGNQMSVSRRINYMYRPVIELQAQAGDRAVAKDTLETVRDQCDALKAGDTWTRFASKALTRRLAADHTPRAGSNAAVKVAHSPAALSSFLSERLGEAYRLNVAGEHEQAQAVLNRLLENALPMVAPALFDGDEALAHAAIVEGFKRGSSSPPTAPVSRYAAFLDYLPESTWPHATALACEAPGDAPDDLFNICLDTPKRAG